MRRWRHGLVLGPGVLALGCGLTTQVLPVARGTWGAEAAVSGPFVRLGGLLPVRLSTVGVRYGVAERADVAAHAHLTPLAFGGAGVGGGGPGRPLGEARGGAPP